MFFCCVLAFSKLLAKYDWRAYEEHMGAQLLHPYQPQPSSACCLLLSSVYLSHLLCVCLIYCLDVYFELLVQSLVSGVDMEDLGVRSCATPFKNSPAEQAEFPEELKQYVKVA